MKEFGIYNINKNYLDEFLKVENKLSQMKLLKRPFVCVKLSGTNWLVPLSSINPKSYDYIDRLKKQNQFNYIDSKNSPKCMDIFDDLLRQGIKGYKSVAQYYNAIPVKQKYCRKYRGKDGEQIMIDNILGKKIRGQLSNYISSVKKGKLTGFIKHFVEQDQTDFRNYPINCMGLGRALYKTFYEQKNERILHNAKKQIFLEEKEHKKELKKSYKRLTEKEQVVQISQLPAVEQKAIENVEKQQAQQVQQVRQVEQVHSTAPPAQRSDQTIQAKKQNNIKQRVK